MGKGLLFDVDDPYVKAANTMAQASQSTSAMMKGYKSVTKKKTDASDTALQGLAAYELQPKGFRTAETKGAKAIYQGLKGLFTTGETMGSSDLATTEFMQSLGTGEGVAAAGGAGEAALSGAELESAMTLAPNAGQGIVAAMGAGSETAGIAEGIGDAGLATLGGTAATEAAAGGTATALGAGAATGAELAAGGGAVAGSTATLAAGGAVEGGAAVAGGAAAGLSVIPVWGWAALGALAIGAALFS